MRAGLVRWLWGVVFLSLWGGGLAQGQALDLGGVTQRINPGAHLAVLGDPVASLTWGEALRHSGWLKAQPWQLNQGGADAALWMRLRVANHSQAEVTRWLVLGNPQLEQVTYFRLDTVGAQVREHLLAGVAQRRVAPLVPGREVVFAVRLAPGEEALLLLRVQGRTIAPLAPALWDPLAYREFEGQLGMAQLAPLAVFATVALYLLVIALARRDRLTFLLAVWLLLGTAYDFVLQGHLHRSLMSVRGDFMVHAPYFLALLAHLVLLAFVYYLREKCLHRALRQVYLLTLLVLLAFPLSSTFGEWRWSMGWSLWLLTAMGVVWPLALVRSWRTQSYAVRVLSAAIILTCGFGLVQVATYLGGRALFGFAALSATEFYQLSLVMAVLFGVVRQSLEHDHALLKTQAALLAAGRGHTLRLEEAVRLRTLALHQATADADQASLRKKELLTRVGHDLRAPLTAIMGYAQIIKGFAGDTAEQARRIERSSKQLMVLINRLIDFARGGVEPDALRLQSVYSNDFLQNIVAHAARLALKNKNSFDFQVSGHLPPVIEVDAKRLRQVLRNLLSNAAKFTHQGHIELQVEILDPGEGPAEVPLRVAFTVRDTGPGIAEETLPTIFHPFQRLGMQETPEGIGLGLAVVYRWVRRMGGGVSVSSILGQGTAVHVRVPIRVGREDSIGFRHLSVKEMALPDLQGSGHMIWVVDDSRDIREMLCIDLVNQGFSVLPMADGLDVIRQIAADPGRRPDLILTDLNMPQSNGWAVLQAARTRWPEVPVLLMTATLECVTAQGHAFSAVMPKPVSLAALRRNMGLLLGLKTVPERGDAAA